MRRLFWAGLLVLVAWGCQPPAEDEKEADAAAEGASSESTRVETITLNTTTFGEVLELNGETEAFRTAQLSSPVPGRISKLKVEEGQPVEEGASVLVVDTATQRAQIGGLDIQLEQVKSDIKRTEKLVAKGLATKAQLETLETSRDSLEQSIRQVRVGIRQATSKAPISGMVTVKHLSEGEVVNPGVPVATIVDTSMIVVNLALPERDIKYVLGERGQSAKSAPQKMKVRIEALDLLVEGEIARVGLEANTKNRTFPVEIHIPNPDGYLRAGMRATGLLERRRFENVVVVPRDALLQAIEGSEVMVVGSGAKAEARAVETGPGFGRYAVISGGLEAGEQVVVRGHRALVHGEPVLVSETQPCCREQLQRYREKHFGVSSKASTTAKAESSPETNANLKK